MSRLTTLTASLVALASLGAQLSWSAEPALLSVEVLRGFASAPAPGGPHPRVEVLLDGRSSMATATAAGPTRWQAARAGAERFLAALAPGGAVGVSILGAGPGTCNSWRAIGHAGPGRTRAPLLDGSEALAPQGGGSLAEALEALASEDVSHVVAFTDLSEDCDGDLCAAAAALADAGAQLDLVVLGDTEVPECVRVARAKSAPGESSVLVPPRYRVYRAESGDVPELLAEGWIGGDPIHLEAAAVQVLVALDPPALIGPLDLVSGRLTRLSMVEFPGLTPRVREWRWETAGDSPDGTR